jgi:hypothetical protein
MNDTSAHALRAPELGSPSLSIAECFTPLIMVTAERRQGSPARNFGLWAQKSFVCPARIPALPALGPEHRWQRDRASA